jgi:hypothetical protein
MPSFTYPKDARQIEQTANLENIGQDKPADWRAARAGACTLQRRYENFLTRRLVIDSVDLNEFDRP